jgi:hypothetical protein
MLSLDLIYIMINYIQTHHLILLSNNIFHNMILMKALPNFIMGNDVLVAQGP